MLGSQISETDSENGTSPETPRVVEKHCILCLCAFWWESLGHNYNKNLATHNISITRRAEQSHAAAVAEVELSSSSSSDSSSSSSSSAASSSGSAPPLATEATAVEEAKRPKRTDFQTLSAWTLEFRRVRFSKACTFESWKVRKCESSNTVRVWERDCWRSPTKSQIIQLPSLTKFHCQTSWDFRTFQVWSAVHVLKRGASANFEI